MNAWFYKSIMKRLKKYTTLLMAVRSADPKTRAAIIKSAPDDFLKAFIEIALNVVKGNIEVSPSTLNKLRRKKTKIRRLAQCRGKEGVQDARDALSQKGGILPFLIPLLGLAGIGTAIGTAAAAPTIAARAARNATESALDSVENRAKKLINKI